MSHKGGRDASFVAGPSGDHKGESDDEKCGAAAAVGVEIDPDAVTTSVRNAEENGLRERFDAMLPEDEPPGKTYPLVVANILAGTLVQLQPIMAARVARGGTGG